MKMDNYYSNHGTHDPIDKILKRQSERKKNNDKPSLDLTNYEEIERFTEDFNEKHKQIDRKLDLVESVEQEKLHQYFAELNEQILSLQKFYSNATIFLRIYDKKIFQNTLNALQNKLKDLENKLLPKKKFGFKNRTNKVERPEFQNGATKVNVPVKTDEYLNGEICGFNDKENETLVLKESEIEKKDVILGNLKNCNISIYGNPGTMHITNLENCRIYSGPVTTSIFVEKVEGSSFHLACQQLRIHETKNTEFFVHVTSKAIIEDSKNVKFGIYKLLYDGIEEHYNKSGLSRQINNWDKVDDFNWLAIDKPSPNWSKLPT